MFLLSGAHLRQPSATTEIKNPPSYILPPRCLSLHSIANIIIINFITLCVFIIHWMQILPFDYLFFVNVVFIASVFEPLAPGDRVKVLIVLMIPLHNTPS